MHAAAPRIGWPRSAEDLRSTAQCPSCFTALRSTRCSACGLDLRHPEASALAEDSARIADLLEERQRTIERMHADGAAALVAPTALTTSTSTRTAASAPAAAEAPAQWPAPSPTGAFPLPAAPMTTAPPAPGGPSGADAARDPQPPRRSSVQLWLVIAATGLLSAGFVGFLVYAFVNWGIVWQALVLGLVTAAAATGAGLLRRFGLERSAEGVAVVALVLTVLDAWAARANDLAGLAAGTASGYWGAALLVIGALALLWRGLSGIRAPGLIGSALALPGAGLLTAAAIPEAGLAERWWLAGIVAGALGLLGSVRWRGGWPLRPVERMLWLGTASAALVAAGLAAPGIAPLPLADLALPLVLLVASAHSALLLLGAPQRGGTVAAAAFALLAVLALSALLAPAAARLESPELYLLGTLPTLTLAAVLLDLLSRSAAAHRRRVAVTAAVGAWSLAAIPASGALLALVASWVAAAGAGSLRWTATFSAEAPLHGSLVLASFGALAAALAIELVGQRSGRAGTARRSAALAIGAGLLALAPALLPTLGARLVLAAALAVVAMIALRLPLPAALRGPLLGLALGAAALLLSLGWGGPQLAWGAVLGAALLPASAVLRRLDGPAMLLGLLPLAAVGGLVHPGALAEAPLLGGLLAAVLLLGVLARLRPSASPALRALAAGGAPVLAALGLGSLLAEFEASAASAALALSGLGVVAVAAALPAGALRRPVEAGAALVLLVAAALGLPDPGARPLLLVLLAVAALLAAVRAEGLVGAPGLRKHWGWLAYALGALALLDALHTSRLALLEARTLPLAGVLLLLAGWIALDERMRSRPGTAAGPAALLAGLLLALVPSALADPTVPRSIAVLVIGGAALLVGARGPAGRGRRWFDALAVAGGTAVTVSGLLQPLRGAGEPWRTELWALVASGLLVAGAIGLAGRWRGRGALGIVPPVLLVGACALLTLAGAAAAGAEQGALRGAIVLAVLAAVHPLASLLARGPWTGWVGWAALAMAALLGLRLLALGGVELEAVTAPIGAALLLGGAIAMTRRPALRSWPALGAGTAVLFVPSAIAAMIDPAAARIVAVGVLAVAAIVVGAIARLQAPFLLGIAVALVHALVQLRPWLRLVAEVTPVFVWPVLGGALVLALAIRFERRLQGLRRVVLRVASLR